MEEDDKEYNESEDEDFNPEAAVENDENVSSSSDDEDDATAVKAPKPKARKRPAKNDDEELDSGDEATIQEHKKKKRRKGKEDEEESGGEGGLIKTRAQRAAEKEEQREHRRTHKGQVTIDVDALWAQLATAPVGRKSKALSTVDITGVEVTTAAEDEARAEVEAPPDLDGDEYVTIRQSYEFAGQTISEEKRVHRDSAEAKLFLSKQSSKDAETLAIKTGEDGHALRRPLKRASMFEPNPTGEIKGLPPHKQRLRTPSRADVLAQQKRLEEEAKAGGGKAQRLNTVQKSAIDWASHVDAEGFKDELSEYEKSKQGYMSKMDFLQGVQGRRDQDERQARLQKAQ